MRFLGNSLLALFLTAMTLGLLAWAGQTMYTATRTFMEDDSSGRPARERVLNVNVIDAVPSEITPVLTAFGEIEARSVLEVRAPVAGRVVDLAPDFQEGGSVAQGDVLLSIDPTQAETAIAVAQADLRGAQAEVRDAARGLELAQAELAGARVQRDLQAQALQRQRDLDARNVGTAAAVEAAELALANAEQTILTRRGALVQAEARIETADLAQERAQIALDQA
ncbi:MAG: biotin/lipoyl-binding protein, partial [Pseudomonadota bacterium]